jgi:hypothetical protein
MTKLKDLEKAMRPQFVWSSEKFKPMQLNEEIEGAKDLARMIAVGLADMHGFDAVDVMNYLDMEYESHRNKLKQFRENYREALKRVEKETIFLVEDPIKKFYCKVQLCLNAIKFNHNTNPYLKLNDWMNYE